MANSSDAEPVFRWCREAADALLLAKLFTENITPEYVSHGELQGPRALAPGRWAPDHAEVLAREAVARIAQPLDAPEGGATTLVAGLAIDGRDLGVFFVTLSREAPVPFCILEDIVIAQDVRGRGLGEAYLGWIANECRARGIKRLFLESGHDNEAAHRFFAREGFAPVSIVMMKDISG